MGEKTVWVVKCSTLDCQRPATWRTGTWWLCDEDARQQLTGAEYDAGEGFISYTGSTRRVGMCLADDYYTDGNWEGLAVAVSTKAYEASHS